MKIGIGSYTYTWSVGVRGQEPEHPMTAQDLLHKAIELGAEVVQICDNIPLSICPARELDDLRVHAQALNIEIEVGTRGVRPEHLLAYLSIAKQLGSRLVRVVVDTEDEHPTEEETIERIRSVLPEFERSKVSIAIENNDRF